MPIYITFKKTTMSEFYINLIPSAFSSLWVTRRWREYMQSRNSKKERMLLVQSCIFTYLSECKLFIGKVRCKFSMWFSLLAWGFGRKGSSRAVARLKNLGRVNALILTKLEQNLKKHDFWCNFFSFSKTYRGSSTPLRTSYGCYHRQ